MNNFKSQQNKSNKPENSPELRSVLEALSESPDQQKVSESFAEMMGSVTQMPTVRIPSTAGESNNPLAGMQKLMSNLQKALLVSVPALLLVLVVGVNIYSNNNVDDFEDILSAALGDNDEFTLALFEDDDFDDLTNSVVELDGVTELLDSGEVSNSQPRPTTPIQSETPTITPEVTQQESQTQSTEIETTLAILDSLFEDDDVDDSDLDAWFNDDSFSNSLLETYEI